MKISAKEIILRNGKTLILRSAAATDAESLLNHLYVAHSESYKNLNQSAAYWQKFAGFHRLDLSVRTYNTAGIALYEKAGFERVGLLKDMAFIDGEYVSEYSYQKILGSR